MKDRIPTPGQEGRVKITPESGGAAYYAKLEMADNPTQAGDEPIKANLLPDAVATALGLTGNPQVADALALIDTVRTLANGRAQIATGSYTGTGTFGAGNPTTVLCPFSNPKMILVSTKTPATGRAYAMALGWFFALPGIESIQVYDDNSDRASLSFTWGNRDVSWIASGAAASAAWQFNYANTDYYYVILG